VKRLPRNKMWKSIIFLISLITTFALTMASHLPKDEGLSGALGTVSESGGKIGEKVRKGPMEEVHKIDCVVIGERGVGDGINGAKGGGGHGDVTV